MARTLQEAEKIISYYEGDGISKLFYSLNRKAAEMADVMNSINLKNIALDDPKDKTFERLKVIWNDAASIAIAVKTLGETAGVTGDEQKDTQLSKYRITPESIADVLGNTAGQPN